MTSDTRIRVEIGVMSESGETVWPVEFRTWASPEDVSVAMDHVIKLADAEKITSIRTTREEA